MAALISSSLYNGPVEIGLRSLMILAESFPAALDLQRLVILDYLLVHSGDIDGGPASIHPPSPLRAGEVSIRRGLLESGIHLFAAKGLISQEIGNAGIRYKAEDLAATFLDALITDQTSRLRERASWAVKITNNLDDKATMQLFEKTIGRWKTEFVIEGEQTI